MAWPLQIRFLLAATLASSPFIALAVPGGQLAVLAKYENSALRVTESPFVAPRHHAGCHIEGFNAREFAQRHPLVEGASYKATGTMERVEVRQFPDAWGARSGKTTPLTICARGQLRGWATRNDSDQAVGKGRCWLLLWMGT